MNVQHLLIVTQYLNDTRGETLSETSYYIHWRHSSVIIAGISLEDRRNIPNLVLMTVFLIAESGNRGLGGNYWILVYINNIY